MHFIEHDHEGNTFFRPVTGHVVIPSSDVWRADDGEYPVSGDKIAPFLDDPWHNTSPVTGKPLRRLAMGDLLWPLLAAQTGSGTLYPKIARRRERQVL